MEFTVIASFSFNDVLVEEFIVKKSHQYLQNENKSNGQIYTQEKIMNEAANRTIELDEKPSELNKTASLMNF